MSSGRPSTLRALVRLCLALLFVSLVRGGASNSNERAFAAELQRIRQQVFGHATPVDEPFIILLGGGTASGKSVLLRHLRETGVLTTNVVHLDPDEVMTKLDEWPTISTKSPCASEVLRTRVKTMTNSLINEAMKQKLNIIYEGTMSQMESTLPKIKLAQASNYKVMMLGVTVDTSVAIERAYKRASLDRRWVPLDRVQSTHRGFAQNFMPLVSILLPHTTSEDLPIQSAVHKQPSSLPSSSASTGPVDDFPVVALYDTEDAQAGPRLVYSNTHMHNASLFGQFLAKAWNSDDTSRISSEVIQTYGRYKQQCAKYFSTAQGKQSTCPKQSIHMSSTMATSSSIPILFAWMTPLCIVAAVVVMAMIGHRFWMRHWQGYHEMKDVSPSHLVCTQCQRQVPHSSSQHPVGGASPAIRPYANSIYDVAAHSRSSSSYQV